MREKLLGERKVLPLLMFVTFYYTSVKARRILRETLSFMFSEIEMPSLNKISNMGGLMKIVLCLGLQIGIGFPRTV